MLQLGNDIFLVIAGAGLGTGMALGAGLPNGLGFGLGQAGKRGKTYKGISTNSYYIYILITNEHS